MEVMVHKRRQSISNYASPRILVVTGKRQAKSYFKKQFQIVLCYEGGKMWSVDGVTGYGVGLGRFREGI